MEWPSALRAGFVYAAIACDDPELCAASPGLTENRARELAQALPPAELRRAALPGLLAHFGRVLRDPAALPVRMRALLGGHLPRHEARRWLAGAPMSRPGFRADAGLRTWVRLFGERAREAGDA